MTRARLGALIISLLATTGLVLGLTQSAHAAPGNAPARMVVFDCPGQPALVKPSTFIVTCADGNILFDKLSWTSWTPGLASATGTLIKNTCTPSCVAGHFRSYPVLVIFWGKAAVKNHPGEQCYTRMTLIYPGSRPPGAAQTETIPLPTSLPVLAGG